MWIGYPGNLRTMRSPRRGASKTFVGTVTEHEALSGSLRTTSRPKNPRRWTTDFPALVESDADWLMSLARKDYGPGPIVMIESSTRNFLAPQQSLGKGRARQWQSSNGTITPQPDGTVKWTRPAAGELRWIHPVWGRWPVTPGMIVGFRHTLAAHKAGARWFRNDGTLITTADTAGGVWSGTAPALAAWCVPYLSATGAGDVTVPRACLTLGKAAPATWPNGEHCAAFSITNPEQVVSSWPLTDVRLVLAEQY